MFPPFLSLTSSLSEKNNIGPLCPSPRYMLQSRLKALQSHLLKRGGGGGWHPKEPR